MSYHLYQTTGLILGHYYSGEADRLLQIFTRQFGLITALARGVREIRSKLRPNLQDFSVSELGLIRGRELWRVVSAERLSPLAVSGQRRLAAARIFSLLRRLIRGEERHDTLYDDLHQALIFLAGRSDHFHDAWLADYELAVVARVLHHLGYLAPSVGTTAIFPPHDFSRLFNESFSWPRAELIRSINQSLAASQL